ncbi:LysR family transcriptional regulator [Amycolatopsis sp. cg9]|uniref:LysR family transcriptional regulator n=1 Tax=Amycolatopsis sp. cg9 TaxID=3238801 RepID=UPI0035240BE5
MEIRQIEYFAVIVREGSFSRAARKLHIGQPALSKQVQALERELGAELLVRLPGGVRPTAAGARLAELAPAFLGSLDDIRSAVREAAASLTGAVRLGVSPSLVAGLAGHLEERFAGDHPRVRLEIVEALPEFLAERVAEGRLDLGIFTRRPGCGYPGLAVTTVGFDELLLVAKPGTLSDVGPRVTPDLLPSLRLVVTPGFRDLLRASVDPGRVPDGIGSRTDSIHRVRDLVVRGEYRSVLPSAFVRDDLAAGALTAVGFEPALKRELVAVTRAGRKSAPAVRAVIETVRRRLGELEG